MPTIKKYQFQDPQFNMFLHFYFLNIQRSELKDFTPIELSKVTIGKNLRQWCTNAGLEEKLYLLAKSGCPFEIRLGLKDNFKKLEDISGEKDKVIDEMLKSKLFSLSSAKMLQTSNFINHSSQSSAYMFNRNFQKIFQFWKAAKKNLGKWRNEDDLNDIQYGYQFLSELAYKVIKNQSIHADLGLSNEIDILILLYLHRRAGPIDNQNRYVTPTQIFLDCSDGNRKQQSYTQRLHWMQTHRYVLKHPKDKAYTIHDKGYMVVGEYLKKIAEFVRFDL